MTSLKWRFSFLVCALVLAGGCSDVSFTPNEDNVRQRFAENAIFINNDKPYTSQVDVRLTLEGKDFQEMYVTNDPNCETGGVWQPFLSNIPWQLIEENNIAEVYVKFKDESGSESPCIYDDIMHDNIAPVAYYVDTPRVLTNSTNGHFVLAGEDNLSGIAGHFCWSNELNTYVKCDTHLALGGLKEGANSFTFVVTDNAGNLSEAAVYDWTIDITPPTPMFDRVPQSLEPVDMARFEFSATDNYSDRFQYLCSFDGQSSVHCQPPYDLSGLESRGHRFTLRAQDEAGNLSAPIEHQWMVDAIPPTVEIVMGPQAATNQVVGVFEFKAEDQGQPITTIECSIDGSIPNSCGLISRWSFNEGPHELKVWAVDKAGHRSNPAVHQWEVDLTPPVVTITKHPPILSNRLSAVFMFTSSDVGTGVNHHFCTLNGIKNVCGSPAVYNLPIGGEQEFSVVAVDRAGNESIAATYKWHVDVNPPSVTITNGPSDWVNTDSVLFEFESSDNETSVVSSECKLNGDGYTNCSSPHTLDGLSEGRHNFLVRVEDSAGNKSTPANQSFGVDLTPPSIHWVKTPTDHLAYNNAVFQFQIKDNLSGVERFECQLNGIDVSCDNNKKLEYYIRDEGLQAFKLTAWDKAQNAFSDSVSWTTTSPYKKVSQIITVDESNLAIDILFVVDNSGSMEAEQKNMADRMSRFIDQIDELNWRASVTSTDQNDRLDNGDGKIVPFPNGNYFLDHSLNPMDAQDQLGRTVQMGSGGGFQEQGIRSTYRFLERQLSLPISHPKSVLREEAQLAVVLISDEDESDNGHLNNPYKLVEFVDNTWSGKKSFVFHSIIVRPGDDACKKEDFNHQYGYQYERLTNITGGILGDVCASDYGSQLKDIGKGVSQQLSTFALDCEPQDVDGDGNIEMEVVLADGSQAPKYGVKDGKIKFESPIPFGNHQLNYYCLKDTQP